MATTVEDIREWLEEAKKKKCTHMLVVCDTFSWEDYPVFITPNRDVRAVYESYSDRAMQKVMEVYSLSLDLEKQLKERPTFHLE